MAFQDILFPPNISYHSSGGPRAGVNTVQVNSGKTFRTQFWADPLRKYDAMSGVRTDAQLDELHAFFLAVGGPRDTWRFKDWKDFACPSPNGIGVLTAVTGGMQMVKRYAVGAATYDRKITKPVFGTLSFKHNGVATGGVTVDYATGICTVGDTSGTWTWTGEFHVPCYFGTSEFSATYDDLNASSVQLPVMEDRE